MGSLSHLYVGDVLLAPPAPCFVLTYVSCVCCCVCCWVVLLLLRVGPCCGDAWVAALFLGSVPLFFPCGRSPTTSEPSAPCFPPPLLPQPCVSLCLVFPALALTWEPPPACLVNCLFAPPASSFSSPPLFPHCRAPSFASASLVVPSPCSHPMPPPPLALSRASRPHTRVPPPFSLAPRGSTFARSPCARSCWSHPPPS